MRFNIQFGYGWMSRPPSQWLNYGPYEEGEGVTRMVARIKKVIGRPGGGLGEAYSLGLISITNFDICHEPPLMRCGAGRVEELLAFVAKL